MLMILMKLSFVPHNFVRIFFLDQDQDHDQDMDSIMKFNNGNYTLNIRVPTGFVALHTDFSKSKSCLRSGS